MNTGNMPETWNVYKDRMQDIDDKTVSAFRYVSSDDDSEDDSDNSKEYERLERRCADIETSIMEEEVSRENLKNHPVSYIPFGHDAIWAPNVGLALARALMPSKNWSVTTNNGRKIVSCGDKLCDLFEWARSGKLIDYICTKDLADIINEGQNSEVDKIIAFHST
jgi:hypothetical protein